MGLQTQPESEADVLAPVSSALEQSTCLTDEAEPAREPQPLESPRDAWHATLPSIVGAEDIEGVRDVASINSSTSDLNSQPPDSPLGDADRSTLSSDDSSLAYAPRACEDGMQRSDALLPQLIQFEMNRELRIIVPDGMDAETREVPITISKRPALEPNQRILQCRGMSNNTTDRCSIVDSLRHSARPVEPESRDCLNSQEFKHRQFLYSLLRGNAMHPLLPWTPEEDSDANISVSS